MIADRYEPTGAAVYGGMGEVHECIDCHLDRKVVLKRMKPGYDERRLLDEQKALSRLRSKHVVQLYDILILDSMFGKETSLVLEYIDGFTLRSGSFKPDKNYLKTIWQIAQGLTDIHGAGIIHRDIKPENIRVDKEGVAKILDFGLSREADKDAQTRSVIGSTGYMAPELWGDKTIKFTPAIDVYAFGVTALALLDRSLPTEFSSTPPSAIKKNTVAALVPELPSDVSNVLEQCVSHNPQHRPAMKGVRDVLAKHLLYNTHRALIVMESGLVHQLNSKSNAVAIKVGSVGEIKLGYDGHAFSVISATGLVSINNQAAISGMIMPDACVIAFGDSSVPAYHRSFLTFDVSNPEVMP